VSDEVRHLFSAVEAERYFKIPAGTVRTWATRKRIWAYGLDERRRPLYDRDDLLALRDRSRTRDQHERARRRATHPKAL
jgi:hypothetical protein